MNQENLNDNSLENTFGSATETNPEKSDNFLGVVTKCLTFAPLLLEQFTGQKVPQMSGTIVEIQQSINQLGLNVQSVVNNQNKIWQKLTSLENNANQKLFNLTNQLNKLSGFKLTQERERKQIEFNKNSENQEY